jgi:hypothetical protein
MKSSHTYQRLLGIIVSLSFVALLGAAQGDTSNPFSQVPDFAKIPPEQRTNAINDVDRAYILASNDLMHQLQNREAPAQARVDAAFLLGSLGVRLGAPDLVAQIDLRPTEVEPGTRLSLWGEYPAQEALCYLGMSGVQAVLAKLAQETDLNRQKLMCSVLTSVEGVEVAHLRVDHLLQKETDVASRGRLAHCLDLIAATPPE